MTFLIFKNIPITCLFSYRKMSLQLIAIHILLVSFSAEFFVSLVLLQGFFYTLNTPAVLSQAQIKQHCFIHTIGQDLLFRRFPLRKNTFQTFHCSTGREGGREGEGGVREL